MQLLFFSKDIFTKRGSKKSEKNSVMDVFGCLYIHLTIVFFLFLFSTSIKEESSSFAWDMFKSDLFFYFKSQEI